MQSDHSIPYWRPIPGFEGVYRINRDKEIQRVKAAQKTRPGRLLKPSKTATSGSAVVTLIDRGHRFRAAINVIYRLAFPEIAPSETRGRRRAS